MNGKNQDIEKRRLREQNELLRLKAERSKARCAGYFIVLLVMIVLTDVLDNLATNIGGNITSSFITEFFVNGKVFGKSYEYEAGLALHNTISLIGYVIALLRFTSPSRTGSAASRSLCCPRWAWRGAF